MLRIKTTIEITNENDKYHWQKWKYINLTPSIIIMKKHVKYRQKEITLVNGIQTKYVSFISSYMTG